MVRTTLSGLALLALAQPAGAGEDLSLDALLDLSLDESVEEPEPLRGQDPRYTRTILDGLLLPAWPAPDLELQRPSVSFLPPELIARSESLTVATPDLPATFGGGAAVVETLFVPRTFFARVSFEAGWNSRSTGVDARQGRGGTLDALGFDDGTRALPDSVADAMARGPLVLDGDMFSDDGWTEAQLNTLVDELDPAFDLDRKALGPDLGLSASVGNATGAGSWRAGWAAGLSWSVQRRWDLFESNTFAGGDTEGSADAVVANEQLLFERTAQDAQTGLFALAGAERDGHAVQALALFSGSGTDETLSWRGYDADEDEYMERARDRFDQRGVGVVRVRGRDRLGAAGAPELAWSASYLRMGASAPDAVTWDYRKPANDVDSAYVWNADQGSNTTRSWEATVEQTVAGTARLRVPFQFRERAAIVEGGVDASMTWSTGVRRQLAYSGSGLSDRDLRSPPGQLFSPAHTGDDVVVAEDLRDSVVVATAPFVGAFAAGRVPISDAFQVTAGLRLDSWHASVDTKSPFRDTSASRARAEQFGLFPSGAVSFAPPDKDYRTVIAYSRTADRPTIRELSTVRFYDPVQNVLVTGRANLFPATIDNVDWFVELSPTSESRVRFGPFAKYIRCPIESVIVPGATPVLRAENAWDAQVVGVDVGGELALQDVAADLKGVVLDGSLTFVGSRITLMQPNANTNQVRPLRGQAPWVVDVGVAWSDWVWGADVRLGLLSSGPRVFAVGSAGVPDQILQPFHDLRLSAKKRLWYGLDFEVEGQNLLNSQLVYVQGEIGPGREAVARTSTPGTTWVGRLTLAR